MWIVFVSTLLLSLGTCHQQTHAHQIWNTTASHAFLRSSECTIARLPASKVTTPVFRQHFLEKTPLIVTNLSSGNAPIAELTARDRLLRQHGEVEVVLSTANTFSYEKKHMLLREYINGLQPQDPDQLGSASLLLFGPAGEISAALAPLIALYRLPPHADGDVALSFGIGASGSGVPFHVHGHGWAECIHGAKRWLLFPPELRPPFDPDSSSSSWLRDVLPTLTAAVRQHLQDCVIEPGEALYFPSHWWHATVNVGDAVFMSTFLSSSQQADPSGSRDTGHAAELR